MAAKHHITVAEIHENNAADLEKVINNKNNNWKNNWKLKIVLQSCTQLGAKRNTMHIHMLGYYKSQHRNWHLHHATWPKHTAHLKPGSQLQHGQLTVN